MSAMIWHYTRTPWIAIVLFFLLSINGIYANPFSWRSNDAYSSSSAPASSSFLSFLPESFTSFLPSFPTFSTFSELFVGGQGSVVQDSILNTASQLSDGLKSIFNRIASSANDVVSTLEKKYGIQIPSLSTTPWHLPAIISIILLALLLGYLILNSNRRQRDHGARSATANRRQYGTTTPDGGSSDDINTDQLNHASWLLPSSFIPSFARSNVSAIESSLNSGLAATVSSSGGVMMTNSGPSRSLWSSFLNSLSPTQSQPLFPYGSYALQGNRPYMEDALTVINAPVVATAVTTNSNNSENRASSSNLTTSGTADHNGGATTPQGGSIGNPTVVDPTSSSGMEQKKDKAPTFYGVFDGHGGDGASKYCAEHLCLNIMNSPSFLTNPRQALTEGFLRTDDEYVKLARQTNREDGTTAIVVLAYANKFMIANVGDSRALLISKNTRSTIKNNKTPVEGDSESGAATASQKNTNKKTNSTKKKTTEDVSSTGGLSSGTASSFGSTGKGNVDTSSASNGEKGGPTPNEQLHDSSKKRIVYTTRALSHDHKPNRSDEHQRIKRLGGNVLWFGCWRVEGILAVSRAIGDWKLKEFITADPEIITHSRTDNDAYIVMGSDGLWDVLKNDDIVASCEKYVQPKRIAEDLCKRAYAKGSQDNICCICIDIRQKSS
eukprot:g3669.t1